MITKAQAVALRQQFINQLPDRIDAAITSGVLQRGLNTFTVSYDPASNGAANLVLATYVAAGWATSSIDTATKTITIAP